MVPIRDRRPRCRTTKLGYLVWTCRPPESIDLAGCQTTKVQPKRNTSGIVRETGFSPLAARFDDLGYVAEVPNFRQPDKLGFCVARNCSDFPASIMESIPAYAAQGAFFLRYSMAWTSTATASITSTTGSTLNSKAAKTLVT
jgi:hypothetical protein